MTEEKPTVKGNFDFPAPLVGVGFTFVRGEDAKALYEEVSKTVKEGINFDNETKTMQGSSTYLAARVDSILMPLGIRVANLRDLSRPEVMEMARRKFYSDTPAIVFRSTKDGYEPNDLLIEQLTNLVEEKNKRLELPALVTGFDFVPSKDAKGYGLDIVARADFKALPDDRLEGRYDMQKFSTVDKDGLPNFERSGKRRWYAKKNGISRVWLDMDLSLNTWHFDESLASSDEYGRLVITRAMTKGKTK